MTSAQLVVLDAIRDLSDNGVSPSYRQIAQHVGWSAISNVHRTVNALIAQGRLKRRTEGQFRAYRSLELVEPIACSADLVALQVADLCMLKGRVEAELRRRQQEGITA